MMLFRRWLVALGLLLSVGQAWSQANFNLTRTGGLAYPMELSSLWGYEAGGRNYALVGTTAGVSIVDITNPAAPVEVDTILCSQSIWRELKTWGNYAYVVADATSDGLLVIDLSNLPNGVSYEFVYPEVDIAGTVDTMTKGHTLIFDENGVLYVSGSNLHNGAVLMFDVTTPNAPVFLGTTPAIYAHDCFARGDTLWTADIYAGQFSVYDISDKANPVLMATQITPSNFTHNLWISDDGRTMFTTDERADAWVAAYDVSDLANIVELDRFRSRGAAVTGIIPHNVHVLNDFLVTAYYTDGVLIMDGSRPNNIVEVGRYDTYPNANVGFYGVWGVYPYFGDGTIIASDMQTGLHIFSPNYQRACWLEGQITEQGTGNPIFGANIRILALNISEASDLNGDYATGHATAGSYNVEISKAGYQTQIATAVLQNGQLTILNVQLVPAAPFGFSGTVREQGSNSPIANAKVEFQSYNGLYNFQTSTDNNGNFTISNFYADNYSVLAGHWGHHTVEIAQQNINASTPPLNLALFIGYKDEFALDLGWTATTAATSGAWERAMPRTPAPLDGNGQPICPPADISNDLGPFAYVTGNNETGQPGAADVDNGVVVLRSPAMDLFSYNDPYLSFDAWFVNQSGNSPDDTLAVLLTNGNDSVVVAQFTGAQHIWRPRTNLRISQFLPLTTNMHIYFIASDLGNSNLVEAAVDVVQITEGNPISTIRTETNQFKAYPNPFTNQIQLDLAPNTQSISIYNTLGQTVQIVALPANTTSTQIGQDWPAGALYLVCPDNKNCQKVIKQ